MGADGQQIGIKPLPEALAMARSGAFDLVEVRTRQARPSAGSWITACRHQARQKAKESRRKSSTTSLKEMKYRPKIGTGDFDTKTRKVELRGHRGQDHDHVPRT
ncbi:MAG: hypothetical protein R2699_15365 [Acidimicrobiales bacterium]